MQKSVNTWRQAIIIEVLNSKLRALHQSNFNVFMFSPTMPSFVFPIKIRDFAQSYERK